MYNLVVIDLDTMHKELREPTRLPPPPPGDDPHEAEEPWHLLLCGTTSAFIQLGWWAGGRYPTPHAALLALGRHGLNQERSRLDPHQPCEPALHLPLPGADQLTLPAAIAARLDDPPPVGRIGTPARYRYLLLVSRTPERFRYGIDDVLYLRHRARGSYRQQDCYARWRLPSDPTLHLGHLLRGSRAPVARRSPDRYPTLPLDHPGLTARFASEPVQPLQRVGLTRLARSVEEDPATLTQIAPTWQPEVYSQTLRLNLAGSARLGQALAAGWTGGTSVPLEPCHRDATEYSLLDRPEVIPPPPLGWQHPLDVHEVLPGPLRFGAVRLSGVLGGRTITLTAGTQLPPHLVQAVLAESYWPSAAQLLLVTRRQAQLKDERVLELLRRQTDRLPWPPLTVSFLRDYPQAVCCLPPFRREEPPCWWWQPVSPGGTASVDGLPRQCATQVSLPGRLLHDDLRHIAAQPAGHVGATGPSLVLRSPLPTGDPIRLTTEGPQLSIVLGQVERHRCAVLLLNCYRAAGAELRLQPIQDVPWSELRPHQQRALSGDDWATLQRLPLLVDPPRSAVRSDPPRTS